MSGVDSILVLIQSLRAGGAERAASNLANAWAERGRPVTLVTLEAATPDTYSRYQWLLVVQSTMMYFLAYFAFRGMRAPVSD